jgi:hypothetical protein
LSDGEEAGAEGIGTDPLDDDSDDDGFEDGAEVAAGTDPMRPDDHPGHRRPVDAVAAGGGCQAGPGGSGLGGGAWLVVVMVVGLGLRRRFIAGRGRVGLLLALAVLSAGFDAQRFVPAGVESGAVTLVGSPTLPPLQLSMSAIWHSAEEPVRLVDRGDRDETRLAVIEREQGLYLRVGLGVVERLVAEVEVPIVVGRAVGADFADEIAETAMGDVALRGRYALLDRALAPVGVGFDVRVSLPTGDEDALAGRGGVGAVATVFVDRALGHAALVGNVGFAVGERG